MNRPRPLRRLRVGTVVGGAVLAVTALVGPLLTSTASAAAPAHPLGNFTVNHYEGLVVAPGRLTIDHVEDLAEIPATQARAAEMTADERSTWAAERCRAAARGSTVTAAGQPAALTVQSGSAQVRPGQAGLVTLRLECLLAAPLPDTAELTVDFRAPARHGPGWREITARADRMTLKAASAPTRSVSDRLTRYPADLLSSPPDRTSAELRAVPGGPPLATDSPGPAATGVLPRGADRWTRALTGLVARHDLTAGFAALALGTALLLGALHALAPGHGKTMMAAAAAAGGRGSLRQVLTLGASVTLTHTLGVFALGGLITAGSAAAPSVVSWLGVVSGALVTGAGTVLVRRAWRNRRQQKEHPHAHGHGHGHGNNSRHTHGHSHLHNDHHHHDHPRSGGLRGTVLLGFAGGLVPSPSAVVVLVGAAALGQAWFGALLVLAYGAGLALTLTAAGYAAIRIGERLVRLGRTRAHGRLVATANRFAPLGTAFVVFFLGCGLVLKGAAAALG
ncbi:nickel transporter [Streptomyces sp. TLI_146]|uniref:nickel transporter n=1 Tax=Streptomyces sp. TLI_146 TaxID=1938858 RepID=UPI000C713502|nr:nickel transporter [Streptomyces sp. TLI_146]PKV83286.1 ABC-type nickel/cobalt efflux system permease component RcnA [Streptomyces sp. TLI_146]